MLLPASPTAIDATTRHHHRYLEPTDHCFYFAEFLTGPSAGIGTTTPRTPINDLINNFKLGPRQVHANHLRWWWKHTAIEEISRALTRALSDLPTGWIVVPIPTSKRPDHPDYDDRMLRALTACHPHPPITVRDLIHQRTSTPADHETSNRQSLHTLLANCVINENAALPAPRGVMLVDDVLTEGKHFKVCQRLIHNRYGGDIPVHGLFISRRVHIGPLGASTRARSAVHAAIADTPTRARS